MEKMGKSKRFIAIILALLQIICGLNLNALEVYAWGGGGTQYVYTDTISVQSFLDEHPEMFSDPGKLPILVSYYFSGYAASHGDAGRVAEIYYVNSTGTVTSAADADAIYQSSAGRNTVDGFSGGYDYHNGYKDDRYECGGVGDEIEITFEAPDGCAFPANVSTLTDQSGYTRYTGIVYQFVGGEEVTWQSKSNNPWGDRKMYKTLTYRFKGGSAVVDGSGHVTNALLQLNLSYDLLPQLKVYDVLDDDVNNAQLVETVSEPLDSSHTAADTDFTHYKDNYTPADGYRSGYTYAGMEIRDDYYTYDDDGNQIQNPDYEFADITHNGYGRHFSIYRFFYSDNPYDTELNVKYQAINAEDNSPVSGVSIFGETTDTNGFIATEDNFVFRRDVTDSNKYLKTDFSSGTHTKYLINDTETTKTDFKTSHNYSTDDVIYKYRTGSSTNFNYMAKVSWAGTKKYKEGNNTLKHQLTNDWYYYKGVYKVEIDGDFNGMDSSHYNVVNVDDSNITIQFYVNPDKTKSYTVKYQAVKLDGTPYAGVELNGETTGSDGYISAEDTIKQVVNEENQRSIYLNDELNNTVGTAVEVSKTDTVFTGGFTTTGTDTAYKNTWTPDITGLRAGTTLENIDETTYVIKVCKEIPEYTHTVRFKAQYSDGDPVEGYTINGETTGADGYIAGTDVFKIAVPFIGDPSYSLNGASVTETSTGKYQNTCAYGVGSDTAAYNFAWSFTGTTPSFSVSEAVSNCTVESIDANTDVVIIDVGDGSIDKTVSVPVNIKYYVNDADDDNWTEAASKDETFDVDIHVLRNGNITTVNGTKNFIDTADFNTVKGYYEYATAVELKSDKTSNVGTNLTTSNTGVDMDASSISFDYEITKDISKAENTPSIAIKLYFKASRTQHKITIKYVINDEDDNLLAQSSTDINYYKTQPYNIVPDLTTGDIATEIASNSIDVSKLVFDYREVGTDKVTNLIEAPFVGTMGDSDLTVKFVYKKTPDMVTLTVTDVYQEADGTETSRTSRTPENYTKNSTYTVNALSPAGYDVVGDTVKTGTITANMEIEFVYKKKASYTITGVDEYYTTGGALDVSNTRTTDTKTEGDSYSYNALTPEGYTVDGDTNFSGTVTGNLVITFKYKKNPPATYTITVIDEYYDNSGVLESSSTRASDIKNVGDLYTYDALTVDGYTCTSPTNYSGIVTGDETLRFTYKKDADPIIPIPVPTPAPEPTPVPTPIVPIVVKNYTIKVIDRYPDRDDIRIDIKVPAGTPYNYDALDVDGYTVSGDTSYTGVVNGDTELVFVYTKDAEPVKTYEYKVVYRYIDEDGNVKDEVVVDKLVPEGSPYDHTAPDKDGYTIEGDKEKSGTVTGDTILIFTYKKIPDKTPEHTVKVIDRYPEGDDVRVNKKVPEGTPYTYKSKDKEGYVPVGKTEYTGTVDGDVTIIFIYERIQYELKVIDRLVDNDSTTDKVRENKKVPSGTNYSYKSIEFSGYTPVGEKIQTGKVDKNTTVIFTYKRIYHTLTVIDRLEDGENVVDNQRLSKSEADGTPYSYESISIEGYAPIGETKQSGIVDEDVTLIFRYQKIEEEPAIYQLKVVDEYYNEDGTFENADTRVLKFVEEGTSYYYEALETEGYSVLSAKVQSGIVSGNTELLFTYKKTPEQEEEPVSHEIMVIDKYITVTSKPKVYSVFNGFTGSMGTNEVEEYEYSYSVKRYARCIDIYEEDADYEYNALDNTSYTVIGTDSYSGVVKKDESFGFVYLAAGYQPEDIPEEVWEDEPDPVIPFAPEPKTGDGYVDNSTEIYLMMLFAGVIVAEIYRRKRK